MNADVAVHDRLFIGGHLVEADTSARIPVVNPATEQPFAAIVDADEVAVDRAVQAAHAALRESGWAQLAPSVRAEYLRKLADALERRGDEIARLVTTQNGMPISISAANHGSRLADFYRYFAGLADRLVTEEVRVGSGGYALVRREPVGVCGLIPAWNGPQGLVAWKLGPALAAGCTAVVKPAPETSLDSYLLAEAVVEAGIPNGVVNVITGGRETGRALVRHPLVAKIAFTGSTTAGRDIAAACAASFKRVTLELGGKSAAILLDDVDLEAFVPFVAGACSPNTGQVCRALTRILAPRSRYEEVVAAVADTMSAIPMGDPLDPTVFFGPLVTARQRERVEGYVEVGRREGAKVVTGGGRPARFPVGWYVEPTVFRDVDNRMRVAREEIFGPVLCVIPYDGEDDAVRIANDSEYGLGGGIFTRDAEHGTDVARRITTGTIGVNTANLVIEAPFGGVKQSG
ncbi:MAG TPA: aldehyde dehydrogenase, partial [Acidimicrobiia bacterium]|nr:aldehyde dehydrogenase [Acidimicrobiia bacterium]